MGGGGRGPLLGGDGFILGTTKPTSANTGLSSPTTSTVTGTVTFNVNDTIITNTRFEGFVNVTGKRITFINCHFVGPTSFSPIDRGLVNCSNDNCEDILFERCHFEPTTPSPALDGIFGHNFTALRCLFRGLEDAIGVHRAAGTAIDTFILGCYIDLLVYHCPNFSTSDNKSHNDCIQIHPLGHQGPGTIRGNTLVCRFDPAISDYSEPVFDGPLLIDGYLYYPNGQWGFSCIQFGSSTSAITNWTMTENWIDNGQYGINLGGALSAPGSSVTNNRWGRAFRNTAGTANDDTNWGIKPSGTTITTTGNAYEDNEAAQNTWKNG